jgi:predicted RNase H-like HicB family nuclease
MWPIMPARPSPASTIELIPDPDQGGFTARVPDIPAYGKGITEDEAIADLKEALRAYIETFGVQEAVSRLSMQLSVRQVTWDLDSCACRKSCSLAHLLRTHRYARILSSRL